MLYNKSLVKLPFKSKTLKQLFNIQIYIYIIYFLYIIRIQDYDRLYLFVNVILP